MESRISIDLDWDNQPIIRIDYKPSEDVRDKMVKRFMESFGDPSGLTSTLATFFFSNTAIEQSNTTATIRPLPIKEFEQHSTYFHNMVNQYKDDVDPKVMS